MKLFIFLTLSMIGFQLQGQIIKILNSSQEVYLQKDNGKYYYTEYFKSLDGPDTFVTSYEVYFRRKNDDRLMGADYRIQYDSLTRIYDGTGWYIINSKEKSFYKLPLSANYRYLFSNRDNLPMLSPEFFFSSIKFKLRKSISETDTHYIIKAGYKTLHIRKSNYLIDKIEEEITYKDSSQYLSYVLESQKYDEEDYALQSLYDSTNIPNTFLELKDEGNLSTLTLGDDAPDWTIPTPDGKILALSDFKGKYVMLDFWYQTCYPCIKALPSLHAINERFKDDNFILIAINPYDNSQQLTNFIEKRKITYQVGMALNSGINDLYQIDAYPTIYIIDPNGRIVYVQEGYNSNQKRKLKILLKQLLNSSNN